MIKNTENRTVKMTARCKIARRSLFSKSRSKYRINLVPAFWQDQKGVFAPVIAMMFPVMLGFVAWGIEGTRYLYEKARLSDTLEQATLALTVENNGNNGTDKQRNKSHVADWIRAYMPDASISIRDIGVRRVKEVIEGASTVVTWRAAAKTRLDSWFSSDYFPSFSPQVGISHNAAAGKNLPGSVSGTPDMDVMFVADFSNSMNSAFSAFSHFYFNISNDHVSTQHKKISALKTILQRLAQKIYVANGNNRLGFVPFSNFAPVFHEKYHATIGVYANPYRDPAAWQEFQTWLYRNPNNRSPAFNEIIDRYSRIDYPKTLDHLFTQIDINNRIGKKDSESWFFNIPLTSNLKEFNKIASIRASGATFIASGILEGVRELHRMSKPGRKQKLIMLSDGDDDYEGFAIKKLIKAGMCEKIKAAGIEMIFIGIDYHPTLDWAGSCVGKANYYEPQTVAQLEAALQESVFHFEPVTEEMGRNIPKKS